MGKMTSMHKREFKIAVIEYETLTELSEEDQKLILSSRQASKSAYAPYSGFYVGASILLENNEIISGSNQENSAFTNGLCAERVALFYANSRFPDVSVRTIAISAENENGLISEPVNPCGACRQALAETEIRFQKSIRIILNGKNKILVFENVQNLLPFAFKPDSLD